MGLTGVGSCVTSGDFLGRDSQEQSIPRICKVWVSLGFLLPTIVVWWGTDDGMEQQEQAVKSHFCCFVVD